jgi:hypothetical protein
MKPDKPYLTFIVLVVLLSLSNTPAQQPAKRRDNKNILTTSAPVPSQPLRIAALPGAAVPVTGSGTVGQLTRWVGSGPNGGFILGDSIITEDKFGKVGIGTTTPTSTLTVVGMIATTLGGYKFPDGTVQTTAAVSGLQSVFHDATLAGDGSGSAPLKIAVPLTLNGAVEDDGAVLSVTNISNALDGGDGLHVTGATATFGGTGVVATGGKGSNSGGIGLKATGNSGTFAGAGVFAEGGDADGGGQAGDGVTAIGGFNRTFTGGLGLFASGGGSESAKGGDAVFASGADSEKGAGGDGLVAVAGSGPEGNGLAGDFFGNVSIAGDLNVTGTKNFRIDHPLDPANKYLLHAAVESSEVLNVYSGNVKLDNDGSAVIAMPNWFEAVNRDFRYTLTAIGAPAPGLHIAEKLNSNRFKIAGGVPGMEVSWQVTGVRSDAAMRAHPFKVEEDKPERERGTYLTPEAYGKSVEKAAGQSRHATLFKRAQEMNKRKP